MAKLSPIRAQLAKLMKATLADEAAHGTWTYRAVRPMPVPPSWKPGQAVVSDCSKGVQMLVAWATNRDLRFDPMGNGYDLWGNSTTIAAHLQHLASPSELEVADVVTFGPNGDAHAGIVLEAGDDPLLWSDGHQGAPNTYRLSQDGREAQYLRLPVPDYVPTHEDDLRAKTGYWAWLQWSLGEGDWKPYAKADRSVRPDVPRLIPAGWWKRRAQFILNRKKGNPSTTKP